MIAIFPETLVLAKAGDVERLAVVVRRYFEHGKTTPRPELRALLARAGLSVGILPGIPGDGGEELGALVAKDRGGAFRIAALVAPELDPARERFLLAHLLGHYLLDVLPLIAAGDYSSGGFRELACPLRRYALTDAVPSRMSTDERRERRADAFAAALLLPRGMLRKAHERLKGDAARTAAFFGVTKAAVERRLAEIGVEGGTRAPASFLEAESLIADARSVQEVEARETVVQPPDTGRTVPRSYAASTYGNTEKRTAKPVPKREPDPSPVKSAPPKPGPNGEAKATPEVALPHAEDVQRPGMARLREIARKLDKNVPK